MGKRSNFKRKRRDLYQTPLDPVFHLLPFLPLKSKFCEPCAGAAKLVQHLESFGHKCVAAYDLKPLPTKWTGIIKQQDTLHPRWKIRRKIDFIITNPPYLRPIMHAMIEKFSNIAPTWLLIEYDWLATKQSRQFRNRIVAVVIIGRIKWFPKTKNTGKENYVWVLFDKPNNRRQTKFYGPKDDEPQE